MSNTKELDRLREGIELVKAGNSPKARIILKEVIQLNPENEIAWMWYAGIGENALETWDALQQVLRINPNNVRAKTALNQVRFQAGTIAVKVGKKAQGREILLAQAAIEPEQENVWLWLASSTDVIEESMGYLEKVLAINPTNERAIMAMDYCRKQLAKKVKPWVCPICQAQSEAKLTTCHSCGVMLNLVEVESILNHVDVNEPLIRDGISRLIGKVRVKPDFTLHFYIGIAYLNLQQLNEAVGQFRAALRLQAHEPLRAQVENLEQYRQQQSIRLRQEELRKAASKRKVLVVDDSTTIRKLVSITLVRQGYEVQESADGEEALEKIQSEGVPDLILLDIMMPGMDGYTLCKQLRSNKSTSQLPIIMLSGKDGLFNKMRGRMVGSTLYLTKPFQPDHLIEVVQKYCPCSKPVAVTV